MFELALEIECNPGVIHGTGGDGPLNIADQPGAGAEPPVRGEHGLEPAGREHEVVVEQGEDFAARHSGAAVVGRGVTEVALVEHDLKRG